MAIDDTKIVLIGAGSSKFGMKTMTNIIWELENGFDGCTVTLLDINEKEVNRTKAMGEVAIKQLKEMHEDEDEEDEEQPLPKGTFKVEATTNRKEALENATFIVNSIEINRYPLWTQDYTIPHSCGSSLVYGENGGPGGMFHTARLIPALTEIIQDVSDICPNAYFFNYTNPMSRVCLAMNLAAPKMQGKIIGLCHEVNGQRHRVTQMFKDRTESVSKFNQNIHYPQKKGVSYFDDVFRMTTCGLNHFAFMTELRDLKTDEDLMPMVLERAKETYGTHKEMRLNLWYAEHFGQMQYTEDSHSGEYTSWAGDLTELAKPSAEMAPWAVDLSDNGYLNKWDAKLKMDITLREEHHKMMDNGSFDQMMWWITPSGERVGEIMKGLMGITDYRELAVNVMNDGYIPGLWRDVVVEVPARIHKGQITPEVCSGSNGLNQGTLALTRKEALVHEISVKASMEGDRDMLFQALCLDNTVPNPKVARDILDKMLKAQEKYLPQFFS